MQNSTEFVIFLSFYMYLVAYVFYCFWDVIFYYFCLFQLIKGIFTWFFFIGLECLTIIYYFIIISS